MTPITFVVGAGASREFQGDGLFPIGTELAQRIEQLLDNDLTSIGKEGMGPISSAISLSLHGFSALHRVAMARIRDGIQLASSIDEFVDHWKDIEHLEEIAKLSISYLILDAERRSDLFKIFEGGGTPAIKLRRVQDSWLGILIRRLRPEIRRRDITSLFKDVSFITFNYDRCIEHYLRSTLIITHGIPENEADDLMNSIPIHHVYGDLGKLTGSGSIPFGAQGTYFIRSASKLKTYTEEVESGHAQKIAESVQAADKVVFLGCSYHPQNMSVIVPKGFKSKSTYVWGTAFEMKPRAIQRAHALLQGANVMLESVRCNELLNMRGDDILDD